MTPVARNAGALESVGYALFHGAMIATIRPCALRPRAQMWDSRLDRMSYGPRGAPRGRGRALTASRTNWGSSTMGLLSIAATGLAGLLGPIIPTNEPPPPKVPAPPLAAAPASAAR